MKLNRDQKRKFINELIRSVKIDVIKKVSRMPPEWDGIELREYIAWKFAEQTGAASRMSSERRRNFDNKIITRNI